MAGEGEASPDRDKAVRDLWARTLAQIPTVFGRIFYLASVRNPNTARYEHFGLAQRYSEEDAERALRLSHLSAFAEWLNYPLSQQKQDLQEYLASLPGERDEVLSAWASLNSYRNLMPADATEAQRQLFLGDLEIILDLMRNEISASAPTRGA